MISIFILLIIISVALNIGTRLLNSIESRRDKVVIDESMYAICSELKYNISLTRIKEELISGSVTYKYNSTLLNQLLIEDLLTIEDGFGEEDILKIEIIESNEALIRLKISIKYKGEILEQQIIKAEWMDEV
jgi:hypothetical protein